MAHALAAVRSRLPRCYTVHNNGFTHMYILRDRVQLQRAYRVRMRMYVSLDSECEFLIMCLFLRLRRNLSQYLFLIVCHLGKITVKHE